MDTLLYQLKVPHYTTHRLMTSINRYGRKSMVEVTLVHAKIITCSQQVTCSLKLPIHLLRSLVPSNSPLKAFFVVLSISFPSFCSQPLLY